MRNEVFNFLNRIRDSGTASPSDMIAMMEKQFEFTPEEAKMNFYQWTQNLVLDEGNKNEKNSEAHVNSTWSTQKD